MVVVGIYEVAVSEPGLQDGLHQLCGYSLCSFWSPGHLCPRLDHDKGLLTGPPVKAAHCLRFLLQQPLIFLTRRSAQPLPVRPLGMLHSFIHSLNTYLKFSTHQTVPGAEDTAANEADEGPVVQRGIRP